MVTTSKGARSRVKRKPSRASEAAAAPEGALATGEAGLAAGEAAQGTAAERRRAEALLSLIERRKGRLAEDFYEVGEALRELQRRRLYAALGHASFAEMLRARRVMGLSQAKRLVEVVSAMPRERAIEIGAEKALALVREGAATPGVDPPGSRRLRGAAPEERPIEDPSAREDGQAADRVKAKARGAKPPPAEEREALQAARKLQAWIRERGAGDAIAVAHRGKAGWVLRLEVRVDAVGDLIGE